MLQQIRSGKDGRDAVIKMLYQDSKLKNMIYGLILKSGGEQSDAQSVFNQTLIQFIKTVIRKPDLQITSTLNSYIAGIARYCWYEDLGKRKKPPIIRPQNEEDTITPEKMVIDLEKKNLLQELLSKMKRNCKEVLMHWANGFTMNEIADMMDYKSFKMAKKKKYECMKQLLAYLEQKPELKEALR